ncbi:MAG: 2-octaprenyl-6-methoxyphenyl hydroxylase [Proteobacteria bacterium]|nr:2-octaprenyl-6-methoxyphenyl hydroxylase [Pseudomonadota bacterium]
MPSDPLSDAAAGTLEVDVAIIGGGMVGASLAVALGATPLRVLLAESVPLSSQAQPSFDERTTALGNASRRIFGGLGVWDALRPDAAAIRTIHVSEAGRFGFARLVAAEQGIDAFGYVVANRRVGAALWQQLTAAARVQVHAPADASGFELAASAVGFTLRDPHGGERQVRARLAVAADGAHSQLRAAAGIAAEVEDYQQVALVANVATEPRQRDVAYERFTDAGPLAVLPLQDGSCAVIWACSPERAQRLLALPDAQWLAQLQQQFGWRAGRFTRAGRRASYPLKLTRAATTAAQRTVLIGNAAQALHPVAGQGFNLGLRDAAMLAEVIADHPQDPGAPQVLQQFADWRARDRRGVVGFTDSLVKLFSSTRPGVGLLRNMGLLLFDLTPPAKSALARVSAGFGGPTPRLARGLPLLHV